MSSFDVKGLKDQGEAQNNRQRFESDGFGQSQGPLYVGAMISALMLYFESVQSSAEPAPHHAKPHPRPQGLVPHGSNLHEAAPSEQQTDAEVGAQKPSHAAALLATSARVTSSVIWDEGPLRFNSGVDVSALYSQPAIRSLVSNGAAVNFAVTPVNDNGHSAGSVGLAADNGETAAPAKHTSSGKPHHAGATDPDKSKANRRPVRNDNLLLQDQILGAITALTVSDLLQGVSDPDGDKLSVRGVTVSSGSIDLTDHGYKITAAEPGKITVSYLVSDGQSSIQQTAEVNIVSKASMVASSFEASTQTSDIVVPTAAVEQVVTANVILGTDDNDVIQGTDANDVIKAGAGDDVINAKAGDDIVHAGAGNDHVSGGAGNDRIYGETGNDVIDAGTGADIVAAGSGDDVVVSPLDGANDSVDGGEGYDTLDLSGSTQAMLIDVGHGLVISGDETDTIDDFEAYEGGSSDDVFVANIEATPNTDTVAESFSGNAGYDKLSYAGATDSVTVSIAAGQASGSQIGVDLFDGIEEIVGGSGDDVFEATAPVTPASVTQAIGLIKQAAKPMDVPVADSANSIVNHVIAGGSGFDTLTYAGTHDDLIVTVSEGKGTVTGTSLAADDFNEIEAISGGSGDDTFVVGTGVVTLDGKAGNDVFVFASDVSLIKEEKTSAVIKNFEVGDVVKMSKYDIFEKAIDKLEDAISDVFEKVYGDHGDDDVHLADAIIPIRIRHEMIDNVSKTFIDADVDTDGIFDISVTLDGSHDLIIVHQTPVHG